MAAAVAAQAVMVGAMAVVAGMAAAAVADIKLVG